MILLFSMFKIKQKFIRTRDLVNVREMIENLIKSSRLIAHNSRIIIQMTRIQSNRRRIHLKKRSSFKNQIE